MEKNYLILRAYLKNKTQFRIEELETVWKCSSKTVHRRLKKYESNGLLLYTAGVGRGNVSTIYFTHPFKEEWENGLITYLQESKHSDSASFLSLFPITRTNRNSIEQLLHFFISQQFEESPKILSTFLSRPIITLDPRYAFAATEAFLFKHIGDTLFEYDCLNHKIQPRLAYAWRELNNSSKWVIFLRKGIRFHNGEFLNSFDVLYTFRQAQKESSLIWALENIKQIQIIDDYTLSFELFNPDSLFLRMTCSVQLTIVPDGYSYSHDQWIGTGGFKLEVNTPQLLRIVTFDNYFAVRPLLDQINFQICPKSENISSICEYTKILLDDGFNYIIFNSFKPHLIQDSNFREAIYHLVDVTKMFIDLNRSTPSQNNSYFPNQKKSIPVIENRIIKKLRQAGYNNEKLVLGYIDSIQNRNEAEWISSKSIMYGLNLELIPISKDQFHSPLIENKLDMMLAGELPSEDLEWSFLQFIFNPTSLPKRFLSDPIYKKLYTTLAGADNQQKAGHIFSIEMLHKIDEYLVKNNWIIYLSQMSREQWISPAVENKEGNVYGYLDLRNTWLNDSIDL